MRPTSALGIWRASAVSCARLPTPIDVEFVDGQDEFALAHDHGRRVEAAHVAVDPRNADQVFGCRLQAEQRDAFKPKRLRKTFRRRCGGLETPIAWLPD
ncbi:hypothetical protein [Derxia lacustris]|uniref:hypothetical protein n=1 Tax=Derxia lacustris TaxID=764842 RepID=UPI00111BDB3C|nr:hypothetical protein [Derxia lacustris]